MGGGERETSVEGDGEAEGIGEAQEGGDGGVALSVLDIADGGGTYVHPLGEFGKGDAEGLAVVLQLVDYLFVCHRALFFFSDCFCSCLLQHGISSLPAAVKVNQPSS